MSYNWGDSPDHAHYTSEYEEEPELGFHWLDYVVFGLTLMIALGVGVYHSLAGGGQKTTSQYLMGNRQLSPFPVALSIFMSVISGQISSHCSFCTVDPPPSLFWEKNHFPTDF